MRLKDVMALERFEDRGPGTIGLATYPIFDPDYRDVLNEKIIRRYYTQEIGHESIAMFRYAMNREMHEIMPYFNKLYRSEQLDIDPLNTVNLRTLATNEFTTNTDRTAASDTVSDSLTDTDTDSTTQTDTHAVGDVTAESDTTSHSGGESLGMEYPQQQLDSNGRYATTGAKNENATEGTSESSEHNVQDSDTTATEQGKVSSDTHASSEATSDENTVSDGDSTTDTTQTGWQGSQADLLLRYRETFLNIDVMVIDSLQKLFMGVWSNGGSEYADRAAYYGGRFGYYWY